MMRFDRAVALVLAGLALTLVTGCRGSGSNKAGGKQGREAVMLTLANFLGDSGELDRFTGQVQRLSDGAIRIEVKNDWRVGQVRFENGLIGDVRAGKADLGVVGSRAWDSVGVTSLRALTAPLLIDSYALQDRVVGSPLIAQMLRGLSPLGLVGIGVLPGPLRKPLGITRPLLGPSGYAGLRFGVQQSLLADATISALGGRPVWFAARAPITGFGGIEQQISSVERNEYDRIAKYLTANVTLWPRPLVVFASRRAFTSLTADQQAILRQAVAAAIPSETRFVRSSEQVDAASLCRAGRVRFLAANPADLAALHRAVRPVYRQLERDPQTQHVIEEIETMRGATLRETAPSCGAAAAQRSARAGPLDGVYRFAVTLSDLRAASTDPGDLVPENFGTMTVVIDRERFASTQENGKACTWAYGTLQVKGDRFVQAFSDGGGRSPRGAVNKPGELFTFRWSLYRDTVMLRPVSGAVSPRVAMAKPWHRISTKASPRYLSKRCPPPAKALRR